MDASGGGPVLAGGLDEADAAFFSRRGHRCCGCFWAPPWAASSSPSPRTRRAEPEGDEEWWHRVGEGGGGVASLGRRLRWRHRVDALMKVREWSELVAGPRWKTFIRRFRRSCPRHGAAAGSGGKLNYDPLSYALNFDEGHAAGSPEGGDYAGYPPDFSARFVAPPPGSDKSSMDLSCRDAPLLFLHQAHSPRAPPRRGTDVDAARRRNRWLRQRRRLGRREVLSFLHVDGVHRDVLV